MTRQRRTQELTVGCAASYDRGDTKKHFARIDTYGPREFQSQRLPDDTLYSICSGL
jgi:hypothetical protein